jgi:hypothetical protein
MVAFIRKHWVFVSGALLVAMMLPVGYSMSANRQVAYAPCLVKVLAALQTDRASARFAKLYDIPAAPSVEPCAAAAETARLANRAIGDLLVTDHTLFTRLPRMLKEAGMSCTSNTISISCDCKSGGPFMIANPGAYCKSLASVPLPFTRSLTVNVSIHPRLHGKRVIRLGSYVVEMSYNAGFMEPGRAEGATTTDEQSRNIGTLAEWVP